MTDVTGPAFLVVTAVMHDLVKMTAYAKALAESGLYARHGGHYIFIGQPTEQLENWTEGTSVVCAKFPSVAAAHAFWYDAQYQDDVKPLRAGAGEFHVAVFEGVAGG